MFEFFNKGGFCMNKFFGVGNLTRDPEMRQSKNGVNVVNFGVAFRGRTEEDTLFLDVEAWSTGADFVEKWFKKGNGIVIDGSLRQDTWEDKNTGQKRTKVYVRCDHCSFPPGGKKGQTSTEAESESVVKTQQSASETKSDIPF